MLNKSQFDEEVSILYLSALLIKKKQRHRQECCETIAYLRDKEEEQ